MFPVIFSIFMAMTSNSWLLLWFAMELNTLSIMPLMNKNKSKNSIDCSMKYFLVQMFTSNILMFMFILIMTMNYVNLWTLYLMLMMKLGLSPFHFWFPDLNKKLIWSISMILLTLQKLIPFWVMSFFIIFNMKMKCLIFLNLIVSSLGMWNENNIQKILAFSSIGHSSWMMSSMTFSNLWWMLYWWMYTFTLLPLWYYLTKTNLLYINHFMSTNSNLWLKKLLFMSLLSLGGLPPFLGFIPKWFILMMLTNHMILKISMISLSSFTLYIYVKTWSLSLMSSKMKMWKICLPYNMEVMILLSTVLWMMI
uniref:NADH-ubiquinone oxidoreductase chain 2 n=1 Tax=Xenos vesparum TaxID=31928 RepID=Q0QJ99_9NEOP|nr:NADH dehydrogenase subunit 2 [Xenos vesparum]